ncbi:hypothetical protein KSS87_016333 [Heliosperma pusillum]|nr:hypothetical protein KSS87_016333 [Heliosperma pusillum]
MAVGASVSGGGIGGRVGANGGGRRRRYVVNDGGLGVRKKRDKGRVILGKLQAVNLCLFFFFNFCSTTNQDATYWVINWIKMTSKRSWDDLQEVMG